MTAKSHEARTAGPITLDVNLPAGQIRIHAGGRDRAAIAVSTTDATGPSADAVNEARIDDVGASVSVNVRHKNSGGGSVQIGNGNVQVNSFGGVTVGGTNFGSISTGDGTVIINGQRVTGGNVSVGGSPVLIEAWLPDGSSLNATTVSADVEVTGVLNSATVQTVSGDVQLDGVVTPDLQTTSGDITVEQLGGSGRMKAISGDIRVTAVRECSLRASTVSGDVKVSGARVDLNASSVSGRVRNGSR